MSVAQCALWMLIILFEHAKCDFSWSILLVQSSLIGSPVLIWLHVGGVPLPQILTFM